MNLGTKEAYPDRLLRLRTCILKRLRPPTFNQNMCPHWQVVIKVIILVITLIVIITILVIVIKAVSANFQRGPPDTLCP